MDSKDGSIRILMFPWLAYGHIHPFMELAKKLSERNFYIYLCSTPANLDHIKLKQCNFPSVELVELDLPSSPELPPHYHTTKGLPRHLESNLMKAFDAARSSFSNLLTTLKPDLLISDLLQPWAPALALSLNIPTVPYILTGSLGYSFLRTPRVVSGIAHPLRSNYNFMHDYAEDNLTVTDRVFQSMEGSSNIMLLRSFREMTGYYIDEYSVQAMKKIVPVGPLVPDICEENERTEITVWLNKKEPSSVLFISFGSECYLSLEDREELAHGLLLSNVSFIWVLRFPLEQKICVEEAVPQGFIEMVGERGLIVEEWAPQKRILSHPNTGGFLSHCGWSSTMESMKFGVPMIAMPLGFDQPRNAKVIAEVGVGLEIKKEKNGKFKREEIAKLIREVMIEEAGENVRRKARELSDCIRNKHDKEIDEVASELVQLCGRGIGK